MKFKINITQEIIDRGVCGAISKCAFAKAYSELVPVHVGGLISFLSREIDVFGFPRLLDSTPQTAEQKEFIKAFDDGKRVEPTSFEVEIPDKVIEYWYGDAVAAAQHIADSEVLIPT